MHLTTGDGRKTHPFYSKEAGFQCLDALFRFKHINAAELVKMTKEIRNLKDLPEKATLEDNRIATEILAHRKQRVTPENLKNALGGDFLKPRQVALGA